ncbi:hypothetical protein BC826DRAFT_969558 [Russula brevipes]|nr:hypothetical protein BC826DRAFT_969558 [Russula brevipes]
MRLAGIRISFPVADLSLLPTMWKWESLVPPISAPRFSLGALPCLRLSFCPRCGELDHVTLYAPCKTCIAKRRHPCGLSLNTYWHDESWSSGSRVADGGGHRLSVAASKKEKYEFPSPASRLARLSECAVDRTTAQVNDYLPRHQKDTYMHGSAYCSIACNAEQVNGISLTRDPWPTAVQRSNCRPVPVTGDGLRGC